MPSSSPALRVRGLRKAYKDVVAVDGIDLEVRTGECFGLLGPNGAGKTTTIEICEGLTEADAGDVEVLGRRWATDALALRQRLGIQLQDTQLSDKLTVLETLTLFRSFFSQGPEPEAVIALVRLEEKRGARVGTLSGGQKQRLALGCALIGDPELLFLDEPTTGLDPQARRQVWDQIEELKRAGRTIVLTTHYMEEAQRLSDRVAVMDHGKVISLGTPAPPNKALITASVRGRFSCTVACGHLLDKSARGSSISVLSTNARLQTPRGVVAINAFPKGVSCTAYSRVKPMPPILYSPGVTASK